ncbi:hypothetical protein EJ03DRAFT_351062 [Teratosphaeria nubilosa]|uniref:Uncharacterized protein n=1 Tax=Teratosphaeria nubilosa TaxID=161662 RepID=A0A6G1LBK2_9PEZI|nr:hypothetical protein EJ03DRAFT_351062 [Teratosphaeria nubilosa]
MRIPRGTTTTTTTITVTPAQLPATAPVGGEFGVMRGVEGVSSHSVDYTFPSLQETSGARRGVSEEARTASAHWLCTSVAATREPQMAGLKTGEAELDAVPALGIPRKYLVKRAANSEVAPEMDLVGVGRGVELTSASLANSFETQTAQHGFATAVRSSPTLTTMQNPPTISAPPPRWQERTPSLPDMPIWALGILAGFLSFGFVAAIILFLANFPSSFNFHRAAPYSLLREQELDEIHTAAFATSTSPSSGGAARMRKKARNLSVDTSAQYRGLGIAIPGSGSNLSTSASSPNLSTYDEESLLRPPYTSTAAWRTHAITAPLPTISARARSEDLETGVYHHARSEEFFTPASLYDTAAELEEVQQQQHVSWVERLSGRMEGVAGRLARMMYDGVREGGEEEGLVLPIRSGGREKAGA